MQLILKPKLPQQPIHCITLIFSLEKPPPKKQAALSCSPSTDPVLHHQTGLRPIATVIEASMLCCYYSLFTYAANSKAQGNSVFEVLYWSVAFPKETLIHLICLKHQIHIALWQKLIFRLFLKSYLQQEYHQGSIWWLLNLNYQIESALSLSLSVF